MLSTLSYKLINKDPVHFAFLNILFISDLLAYGLNRLSLDWFIQYYKIKSLSQYMIQRINETMFTFC